MHSDCMDFSCDLHIHIYFHIYELWLIWTLSYAEHWIIKLTYLWQFFLSNTGINLKEGRCNSIYVHMVLCCLTLCCIRVISPTGDPVIVTCAWCALQNKMMETGVNTLYVVVLHQTPSPTGTVTLQILK